MKIITEKQKDFVQTLQAMAQGELFDAYAEFLAQENEKYNLTALDARQTRLKHFADSLSAAAAGIREKRFSMSREAKYDATLMERASFL